MKCSRPKGGWVSAGCIQTGEVRCGRWVGVPYPSVHLTVHLAVWVHILDSALCTCIFCSDRQRNRECGGGVSVGFTDRVAKTISSSAAVAADAAADGEPPGRRLRRPLTGAQVVSR